MATTKERPYREHAEKILDRIVTLSRKRDKAMSERQKIFDERDSIDAEIADLEPGTEEHNARSAEWRECVKKIEKLKVDEKYYADQIGVIANKADQAEFDFLDEPVKVPESLYDKLAPKKKDAETKDQHDPHQQTLPMPNPATGEGVAEHMKAAITELELDKKDEKRLIDAGFHTIGALAAFVDDERNHLGEKLECGEGITSRILRALKAFRKAQVKAELAKERGE